MFFEKLLFKPKGKKKSEFVEKPLHFLLEKIQVTEEFYEYEFLIKNKENLLWLLSIFQDIITFGSPTILEYQKEIELVIFHGLLHDEYEIFRQSVKILHYFILSLVSIYPTNLGSQNPNDFTPENFLNFYRNAGDVTAKNVDIDWHMPSE